MYSYLRKFKFPICPVILNVLGSNVCSGVQWYVCVSWSKYLKFLNGEWINCIENEICSSKMNCGKESRPVETNSTSLCVKMLSQPEFSDPAEQRSVMAPVCVCAYFEFSCNEVFLRIRAVSEHIPNRTPNLRLLHANHINSYSTVKPSGTFWLDSNESIQCWI